MSDKHRMAYDELLTLIQDEGYEVVKEQFQSYEDEPDFKAKLWLVPPDEDD